MIDIDQHLSDNLTPFITAPRWLVAYSGGVDSHVLLHALLRWREHSPDTIPAIQAVHVNHQLQDDADQWQQHCERVCDQLDVPLQVLKVDVGLRGQGLEAAARQARYAAFRQLLGPGELLLMAHHTDDRAETLLLHLLRGSGLAGIASIPRQRALGEGVLLRPLLSVTRELLLAYAREQRLQWVDDPSNQDTQHDRNYLRHRVLPQLSERWSGFRDQLARSADLAAQSDGLLAQLAAIDLQALGQGVEEPLAVAGLLGLAEDRRDNLLRYWLRARGVPPVSQAQLQQLVASVLCAAVDAQPELHVGPYQLRRYRDRLYVTAFAGTPQPGEWPWSPPQTLPVPGCGSLSAERRRGQGLRVDGPVTVRLRAGGERCRPAGRGHSQSLKKLLQEYGLEPWWRDRLPLLYCGDQLVAVADLWVCEGFAARAGEEGWLLQWDRSQAETAAFMLE